VTIHGLVEGEMGQVEKIPHLKMNRTFSFVSRFFPLSNF